MTLNFLEKLNENLQRFPDRLAFVNITKSGREAFTYSEIGSEVRRLSRYLQQQGIQPQQKIGILMENHPRWGIAFLAAHSIGAVVVPLDHLHSAETLAHLIEHAECRLLITSEAKLGLLKQIEETLDRRLQVLIRGSGGGFYPEWDAVLDQNRDEGVPLPIHESSLDDPLIIMYTSGTTGDPKGVVLSSRAIFLNIVAILDRVDVTEEDNFLGVLPLYHIFALIVNFMASLYCGARSTLLDVLDAPTILKTCKEESITIFVCVPQFYYLVHRRIQQEVKRQSRFRRFMFFRLLTLSGFLNRTLRWNPGKIFFKKIHEPFGPSLRLFGVGGARFDSEVAKTFWNLGFTILQAYGMTETGAIATMAGLDPRETGSVGRPLKHNEVRIDGPDEGGVGEVLVRGENLMQGYWKQPEATREVIDADGWIHTGDLGYLAKRRCLQITGRKKDVIVLSSGKNIFPEELEHFYESNCPFIKEMCIVGLADASTGGAQERLHAVVVPDFDQLKSSQVANAQDMLRYIIENLSQQLPSHKRVHSFEVWQRPLPRTTTRKIKRFEVEADLGKESPAGRPREPVEPRSPLEAEIFDLMAQMKSGAVVTPEMNLELDLGLDSLERVELFSSLQKTFGIEISDEEAIELFTVNDVVEAVQTRISSESAGGAGRHSWAEILRRPLDDEEATVVLDRLRRRPVVELLFLLFARLNYLVYRAFFRFRVEGLENLPRNYPFMICPNHLSYLDAFVVGAPLPFRILGRFFSLGYASYFSGGFTGFLGRLVKVIPVSADRHLRQALRLAAEGLKRDYVLCVFPEGERSIDGRLKLFRKGPAILATELDIPVVPAGIVGTYQAWSRGSGKIRLHPVTVRYGVPIRPQPDEGVDAFNRRLTEAVRELIQAEG